MLKDEKNRHTNGMAVLFWIGILLGIVTAIPIPLGIRVLVGGVTKSMLANFSLFGSTIAVGVRLEEDGRLVLQTGKKRIVLNGKKKTENKSQSDKKQEKGIDSDAVRKLFAAIGWKSVTVEGVIGFEQKPAKTALITSSSIMIFDLIHNTILSNCAEFATNIVPDYERTRFELHVKIRQKFSLPLIIFLLLRILLQRRSK